MSLSGVHNWYDTCASLTTQDHLCVSQAAKINQRNITATHPGCILTNMYSSGGLQRTGPLSASILCLYRPERVLVDGLTVGNVVILRLLSFFLALYFLFIPPLVCLFACSGSFLGTRDVVGPIPSAKVGF